MYKPNNTRYDNMTYKKCGNSGLMLPIISLGLWHNFGGVDTIENSKKMIYRAFDLGITHFDLANNYGPPPGSAEETFGKILSDGLSIYRDEIIISSKAGYRMWPGPYGDGGSKKYLISSLDQSLKRMNIDYVDIFYSHRFDSETPLEETIGALDHIVKSGKALYVGISSYSTEKTAEAISIFKELGTPCLIHQPSYNMFNRWIEDGLLNTLNEHNMGSIVFSPLSQGLLTDKYLKGIPKDSRIAKPHGFLKESSLSESNLEKIRKLNEVAKARNQTLAQLAIVWVLRHKAVTSALIGTSKVSQIEDIVAIQDNIEISPEELHQIEQILS